ncbi:hypothetical protein UCDDA912_g03306 [Diaporthe ampelina]|uniref:Uncharacterized protein n=1 Tax=Diaporthe ampelina TaxID=1214573 RepID=A0A0G2FRA6_9PEZI|nr:hypothetical protein UCDDA912_g03306 [Diaporthe ampelina]
MVAYRILFMAGAAAALPLNINLGAYSPALVVGDGEISFGGNQDVSGLMSVLEGAAVNAANGAAANGAAQGAAEGQAQAPAAQPAQAQPAATQPAAVPATAAAGSATTASVDPSLQQQAQQIAALQGMGKEIAPRQEGETPSLAKRQTGFDRALQYAEAALVKGPKIQLGTGEGGAGVGIIVDNNAEAAARPGTGNTEAATPAAAAPATPAEGAAVTGLKRRDLAASQKVKVTTMYVRSGVPPSLQNGGSKMSARDVPIEPRVQTIQIAPNKRDASPSPNGIDAVNLNVDGEQGITMTFVETVEDADEDEA